jgi:hypothetical protein
MMKGNVQGVLCSVVYRKEAIVALNYHNYYKAIDMLRFEACGAAAMHE